MPARLRMPRRRHDAQPTPAEARRRLGQLVRFHPSRGNFVAAALTLVLGIAIAAQARSTEEAGLGQLRQTELVALLDDVSGRVFALQDEVRALEADKERLQGEQGDAEAARAAQARLDSYQILAGTVPVEGPGITVQVDDPGGVVTQTMLLDGIQELRDAGAEAIQIGPVRVVASTWVGVSTDGALLLDGQALGQPFTIVAIGDAHTLAGAMAIPGGFTDSLRGAGATAEVSEGERLRIDALHEAEQPRYAELAPSAPSL